MASTSTSKRKGTEGEREVAALLGAKRTPLSGAGGGNDLTLVPPPWDVWGIEVKRRREPVMFLMHALDQAEAALGIGSQRRPAVLHRGDRSPWLFTARLEDVRTWVEALAEMGNGAKVRSHVRELERCLRALKEAV